ncbi:MAG: nodulation protein NfeD [Gammaproteobacteria bacterium]|nr:nodulation protein NfeD [Gammaproteobacteria bacterium]
MSTLLYILIIPLLLAFIATPARADGEAMLIPVQGPIGAATGEMVVRGIGEAKEQGAALVILEMDTPGGLDAAMRHIVKAILASDVPVVTYVSPSGARAASAGTYILYASHVAAMAPATNLGAATPVQVGGLPGLGDKAPAGDGDEAEGDDGEPAGDAMERKMVNDAVAYIRGLAEMRDRNAEWAERAVREAVSLSSSAALEDGVIDVVAASIPELLEAIHGRTVNVAGMEHELDTEGLMVNRVEPGWRTRLLSIIANPNVAYILLMIGIYGLIFELANPGAVIPGTIGAVSLLLALYALQVLSVDYAGVALILLGVALMTAEAFAPSFGVLGLGGLAAFLFGSVILMDEEGVAVSLPVVFITGALSAGLSIWVVGRLAALRHKPVVSGTGRLVGMSGTAREDFDHSGHVRVEGEVWQADTRAPVHKGDAVRVLSVDGLRLEVEPEKQE